jgi:uncharacterized phage-associated protein
MYKPIEIANYFIRLSFKTGEELTPMKLIKLSYISHGWHLGIFSKELLDEPVCAWKFGPVIETLYQEFKRYGNSQITELYRDENCEDIYPMPDKNIEPFLNKIWDVYGKQSGVQLSSLTHEKDTPWDIIWNQRGGSKQQSAIIPNNLIESHYKEKIQSVTKNPIATTSV